jgi:ubiquinone biosynthesis protein UbiJ
MSNENLVPPNLPTVPEMLRMTGANTAEFMKQVADHIDKLEDAVVQLQARITELESKQNATE